MPNRHTFLADHSDGKDIIAADPASHNYRIDEGVLIENCDEVAGKNDHISRLRVETDLGYCPDLVTRGRGCAPDNVDRSVRVRYTQPRGKTA